MSSVPVLQICLVCVYFMFVIQFSIGQMSKDVIPHCLLNSGGIGICTNLHDCDLSLLAQEGKNPAMCEDTNDDVFVCCPMRGPLPTAIIMIMNPTVRNLVEASSTTTLAPKTNKRIQNAALSKSSQKCLEYSKIKCTNISATTTITNGTSVKSVEHYPHMALLGYGVPEKPEELTWQCGGTLISEQYILTAAHCLLGYDRTVPIVAHLGFINKQTRNEFKTLQEFKIVEIIKHPNRVDPMTYEDIALLKLDRPAKLSKSVLPACLHEDIELSVTRAQATGWGDISSGSLMGSDHLMKVTIPILKQEECSSLFGRNRKMPQGIKQEQQFCAGGQDNKDTCQGDSGGPLQIIGSDYCMHSIIGVTSFGSGCGKQAGVYTRVSNYVSWIESVVWP